MDKMNLIKNLKDMKLVAHRLGYAMTDYPENSINVLEAIFSNVEFLESCDGFEFDICFTKDNVPVVIHDKYIDDISNGTGLIKNYTLEELKKVDLGFRKSLGEDNKNFTFKIVTLKEILEFFEENKSLLNDKIIKIETKNLAILNKTSLKVFADILNKFPNLLDNIIHLSYWPTNLYYLRRIQKEKGYNTTKNDLLIDYGVVLFISRFMTFLDNASLRIKTKNDNNNKTNSKRVNRKINLDILLMKFSNVINEKNLEYFINKYGSISLFVIDNYDDIDELCTHISDDFFSQYKSDISITTNNPYYLKNMYTTNH